MSGFFWFRSAWPMSFYNAFTRRSGQTGHYCRPRMLELECDCFGGLRVIRAPLFCRRPGGPYVFRHLGPGADSRNPSSKPSSFFRSTLRCVVDQNRNLGVPRSWAFIILIQKRFSSAQSRGAKDLASCFKNVPCSPAVKGTRPPRFPRNRNGCRTRCPPTGAFFFNGPDSPGNIAWPRRPAPKSRFRV